MYLYVKAYVYITNLDKIFKLIRYITFYFCLFYGVIMVNKWILNLFEKSTFMCFSLKAQRSEMTLYSCIYFKGLTPLLFHIHSYIF